jgi:hypothetical protein
MWDDDAGETDALDISDEIESSIPWDEYAEAFIDWF